MNYTLSQKKEAYKKLSPEVQSFIMDPETTELIEQILNEFGFDENQLNSADSEILYTMYGLQNVDIAIKNIAKNSGKSEGDLGVLKKKLTENIFSKIEKLTQNKGVTIGLSEIITIISQIAQKYSLNQPQQDIILQIIKDHLETESILGTENEISERLNISKLLSEQIVIDVNKRIFEPALKQIEKTPSEFPSDKEKLMSSGTQLELRPENLPMVEKNEPVKVNPVPKPVFQNEVLDKQIPIGVPRYGEQASSNIQNPILEKKLNTTTNSAEAPKKYERDPYREPY